MTSTQFYELYVGQEVEVFGCGGDGSIDSPRWNGAVGLVHNTAYARVVILLTRDPDDLVLMRKKGDVVCILPQNLKLIDKPDNTPLPLPG